MSVNDTVHKPLDRLMVFTTDSLGGHQRFTNGLRCFKLAGRQSCTQRRGVNEDRARRSL